MTANLVVTIAAPDGTFLSADLCAPLPLQCLGVELTSRCNLRCIYCPKSDDAFDTSPGRNMEMPSDCVAMTVAAAEQLKPKTISLSGGGETTTRSDWMERCRSFDQSGRTSLNINSNFARAFSDQEIAFLASLDFIYASIDTTDAALLKEMRRKANLATITHNITRLRAAAIASGTAGPEINIHCVLTDKVVGGLLDLAALCIALGVRTLCLLDLQDTRVTKQAGILSVVDSDAQTKELFRRDINAANVLAAKHGLSVWMSDALQAVLRDDQTVSRVPPAGATRGCLQPWEALYVGADGSVFPCCAMDGAIGTIAEYDALLNSAGLREFRYRMLVGDLPTPCIECTNGRVCEPRELQGAIAQKLFDARHTHPGACRTDVDGADSVVYVAAPPVPAADHAVEPGEEKTEPNDNPVAREARPVPRAPKTRSRLARLGRWIERCISAKS